MFPLDDHLFHSVFLAFLHQLAIPYVDYKQFSFNVNMLYKYGNSELWVPLKLIIIMIFEYVLIDFLNDFSKMLPFVPWLWIWIAVLACCGVDKSPISASPFPSCFPQLSCILLVLKILLPLPYWFCMYIFYDYSICIFLFQGNILKSQSTDFGADQSLMPPRIQAQVLKIIRL